MSIKVLYVGDTQVNVQTSIKGIDSWTFAYYSDSARYLRNALRAADDIILDHIPSMNCIADMPSTVEEMKQYDAILVSDVGYNNIVFQPGNVQPFKVPMGPDRVKALCEYVNQGGGFMMIGGWLSFSGMQGKGMYGGTKVEELLPVTCMPRGADDRMEITEGYAMHIDDPEHPIVKDIDWSVPYLLMGYNKVYLRDDAHLVASYNGDVQIATRQVGKGRSCVYTSDVGPHWAGNFLEHPEYAHFWQQITRWVAGAI